MLAIFITILIVSAAVCLVCHRASIKGKLGETIVAHKLSKLPDDYHVFNDVYLQNDSRSCQIDHVVISPYGIFVIETKNYKGDIFGSDKAEEWTQNIWGNRYSFRNPIKQNRGHIHALMKLFNLQESYFVSIVAFTTRSDLYVDSDSAVLYTSDIVDEILSYQKRIMSTEQVEQLAAKLTYSSFETRDTVASHINYAKEQKYSYESKIYNRICPRCGGQLVERDGRYGPFLGCSNYPRCNFTHKIES